LFSFQTFHTLTFYTLCVFILIMILTQTLNSDIDTKLNPNSKPRYVTLTFLRNDCTTSAQSSTKLPRASRPCCGCNYLVIANTDHLMVPHVRLSATELSRLLHLACGTICLAKSHLLSHCIHAGNKFHSLFNILCWTVHNLLSSQNILVSMIFSGRHHDTLVDLAIVLFY